jgi:RNA recognition motif-containing protein
MEYDLYVGNLSLEVTEDDLRPLFESYGRVVSIRIVRDRILHNSKGYAFVEMDSGFACQEAIQHLEGSQVRGRSVIISLVKDRTDYDSNDNTTTRAFW